ncbi:MAG: phage tail sheath C-terminal domain-containing protein, partial [Saprospiraceae bacterium]
MNLADLKTPGVYVREIPTLGSSIVGVATAIPAFIGYTEKFTLNGKNQFDGLDADAYVPLGSLRIASFKEYVDNFGGPKASETRYTVKVKDVVRKIDDGGTPKEVLDSRDITVTPGATPIQYLMYYQIQMYFANGGGPCYIVPAGSYTDGIAKPKLVSALNDVVAKLDEPTLLLFPDAVALEADLYGVYQAALLQCEELQDRFVIMDLASSGKIIKIANVDTAVEAHFRGDEGIGLNSLKYGAAYHPWLKTSFAASYEAANITIEHKRDFTDQTVDPSTTVADQAVPAASNIGANLAAVKAANAAYGQIKAVLGRERIILPPSGAMAGLYAFTDSTRGVWKAPANISVNQAIGLTVNYNNREQENLNVDADGGKSINIIRSFTGRGLIVWGGRTLDGNSNEWRYINIRRFFNYVEESVKKALSRYVFEANDANTWVTVGTAIDSFLRLQWQAGALQGAKPEQAYFVRLGLGQTMTPDDVLNGRLIIQIGM